MGAAPSFDAVVRTREFRILSRRWLDRCDAEILMCAMGSDKSKCATLALYNVRGFVLREDVRMFQWCVIGATDDFQIGYNVSPDEIAESNPFYEMCDAQWRAIDKYLYEHSPAYRLMKMMQGMAVMRYH